MIAAATAAVAVASDTTAFASLEPHQEAECQGFGNSVLARTAAPTVVPCRALAEVEVEVVTVAIAAVVAAAMVAECLN